MNDLVPRLKELRDATDTQGEYDELDELLKLATDLKGLIVRDAYEAGFCDGAYRGFADDEATCFEEWEAGGFMPPSENA